ncbi:PH domain-like protein [Xylariaceae sp. AK1471]|nr:PH domain-like protein [Xylariaceae sp. AK1471]
MATSPQRSPDRIATEDPDTAAARKELRQTAISEKPDLSAMDNNNTNPTAPSKDASSAAEASGKATTADREPRDESAPEQMASPKKKRAHDEVDEPKNLAPDADADEDPIDANSSTSQNRTDRSEPEKKRPRDVSSVSESDGTTTLTILIQTSLEPKDPAESSVEKSDKPADTQGDTPSEKNKSTTATSAFQSSGISSFATQPSPFLQAGTVQPLSSFAGPSSTASPFGTQSIFTSGNNNSNGTASPFGAINAPSTSFGGNTFGGFGGSLGGPQLTTFGNPGGSLTGGKPARRFGAPPSDDGSSSSSSSSSDEDGPPANQNDEEDSTAGADDKKKPRLQRVDVDDGEASEATLLQVRAKLYTLDKLSGSWKERGAGNLKINVPLPCVDTNKDTGAPIPGSFDASALEDIESNVPRLVMRQDSTHRVILNTAIIPAMKFKEKSSLKATFVLFTAIEDGGAVSIQLKMNAANAKSFLNEAEKVQRELQSV